MQPSHKEQDHFATDTEKEVAARKELEEISKHAPMVLTGGHGGAVPALIVKLVRKIFPWSED